MKRSPLGPGAAALERGSTFKTRTSPLAASTAAGKRSTLKPGKGFAASRAQRLKVAGQVCAVCQSDHVDPAHLAPRSHGGCDHRDCVIGLCRVHHDLFDGGNLDLLPHLSGAGFEVELAHMQGHYSDPLSVLIRLSGMRWVPDAVR